MSVRPFLSGIGLVAILLLGAGCAQPTPVFDSITIEVEKTSDGQNLVIYPKDRSSFRNVVLDIVVGYEDGGSASIKRTWSFWDDPKKIPILKGAKVEKVELNGTGLRVVKDTGRQFDLKCTALFR